MTNTRCDESDCKEGESGLTPAEKTCAANEPDEVTKRIERLDKLAQRLENCGVAEYVKLSQNTGKILFLNLLSGIARGLGFTLGTTIVLAIIYKIVSKLIAMNIPYLTEMLKDFITMIKA